VTTKLLLIFAALAGLAVAQNSVESRAMLNQGVAAFKNANYTEAVQSFQKAVDLDPSFVTARLYLATAYMQQYIPGAESPENRAFAENALREFNRVMDMDPSNSVAMNSIASLYLNQKQWDNAQQWYERIIATNPGNADAYYSMGFIAWSRWYPAYGATRQQLGMKPQDPGPMPAGNMKSDLRARFTPILDQGMQSLEKALAINPQYDDAMAYMNLLIRERADLLDSAAEYKGQIAIADDWVQKALAVKRQKAQAMPNSATPPIGGSRGGGGDRMPPQRIRIAEDVQAAQLVNRVAPVAPAGSQVTGQVVLAVVVGKDGTIMDARAISGPPMLVGAALDAVRKWVYRPTLLNGQPVEVSTTVTLTF
jgi:tetratricopeptide (TPR) repeat protein